MVLERYGTVEQIDTPCLHCIEIYFFLRSAIVKRKETVQRKRVAPASSNNFSHFADFRELGEKYVARDASSYMQRNDRKSRHLPKPYTVTQNVSMSWHGQAVVCGMSVGAWSSSPNLQL